MSMLNVGGGATVKKNTLYDTFMVCEKCLCVPGLHSLAAVTESINLIHGHACAHALSTHPSFGTTSSSRLFNV